MMRPVSFESVTAVGFVVELCSLPARDLTAATFSGVGLKCEAGKLMRQPRPSISGRATGMLTSFFCCITQPRDR
eukprot:361486-Rhodomonas_salina.1